MQQEISPRIDASANTDREVRQLVDRRYEVLRPIGRGAVAHVDLAYDHVLHREVAIKMLTVEAASDPAFVERFRREARAIASLNHPNIVTVYDWGTTGGTDYMVMEYLRGGSLGDLLTQTTHLSEEETLRIAQGVASALAAAHARSIVHRDIKPDNILLTPDRHPKVADFGIAREQGVSALTQTNAVFGTVSYISPEQARGDGVDGRSDLYSLGVVLYQMVTGQLPFRGRSMVDVAMQHVQETPRPPRELRPELSPQTNAIIMKALQKRPEDRYAGADEMLRALRSAANREPRPLVERVPRPSQRAPTVQAGGLVRETRTAGPSQARSPKHEKSRAPLLAIPIAVLALVAGLLFALHPWSPASHLGTSRSQPTPAAHKKPSRSAHRASVSPTAGAATTGSKHQAKTTSGQGGTTSATSSNGGTSAGGTAGNRPAATAPAGPSAAGSAPGQSGASADASSTSSPGTSANNTGSSAVTTNQASPVDAVIAFYSAVGEHRFDDAASLWTPALKQQDPPGEYITKRFADTRSIWVVPTVRSIDTAAGTAVVDVRVTETKASTGQQLQLIGTWQVMKQNGRWLLSWPTFPSGAAPSQPASTEDQSTTEGKSIKVDKKANGHDGEGE